MTLNSANSFKLPGRDEHELHRLWWLYLPILFFVVRYIVSRTSNPATGLESWFKHELGIVENLTVAFLVAAAFITIRILLRLKKQADPLLKVFLVFYLLGLIYFAGEEASWGQHWFGWETGGIFLEINDQQETNFHNTSEWLDRVPKGVVSLAIFIGGVIIPLLYYFKSWKINYLNRWWWLLPTLVTTPTRSSPAFTMAARPSPSASNAAPARYRPTGLVRRIRGWRNHGIFTSGFGTQRNGIGDSSRPGRSRFSTATGSPAASALRNASMPQPAGETAPVPVTAMPITRPPPS